MMKDGRPIYVYVLSGYEDCEYFWSFDIITKEQIDKEIYRYDEETDKRSNAFFDLDEKRENNLISEEEFLKQLDKIDEERLTQREWLQKHLNMHLFEVQERCDSISDYRWKKHEQSEG